MSKANALNSMPTRLLANMCFGSVLAVIGATASAFTTTGTPAVSHQGKLTVLTAQTNTALSALAAADLTSQNPVSYANWVQPSGLTGFYTQPDLTTVYYVIGVTAGGSWKVVQGTYDNQDILGPGGSGYAKGKSVIPDVPDGAFTPVAVLKVVTNGAAFVPGTTALTSIGTFINVSVLPVGGTF